MAAAHATPCYGHAREATRSNGPSLPQIRAMIREPRTSAASRKSPPSSRHRHAISNHPAQGRPCLGVTLAFAPLPKIPQTDPHPPFLPPHVSAGPYTYLVTKFDRVHFRLGLFLIHTPPHRAAAPPRSSAAGTSVRAARIVNLGPRDPLEWGEMLRPYTSVIIHYFRESDKREEAKERGSRGAERERCSRARQSWALDPWSRPAGP